MSSGHLALSAAAMMCLTLLIFTVFLCNHQERMRATDASIECVKAGGKWAFGECK